MKQYFAAVIEDDPSYTEYLKECLARYGAERMCTFQIRTFSRAEAFLADGRIIDDMVFMDVDLGEGWMDGIAAARKRNVEGQIDLFGPSGAEEESAPTLILPDLPEYTPQELMTMEKETTGLYLSGHPMDEYRRQAQRYGAVSIAAVMAAGEENGPSRYGDGANVTLAGVVASVRTKTTKNNSLMAYVVLEDATGSMELLCFSRTLSESGAYLKVNLPVVVTGRVSIRDEKAPQLMVDRVVPLSGKQPAGGAADDQVLWIKLPDGGESLSWLGKLMNMFPGESTAIVYLADIKKRRQTRCVIHEALLAELRETLGEENVVLKAKPARG